MRGFGLLLPRRIAFGRGISGNAAEEVGRVGRRPLVVTGRSPRHGGALAEKLRTAGLSVAVQTADGEPDLPLLESALDAARGHGTDCVVAVGGGAAIDLGKALAGLVPQTTPPLAHLEVVGEGRPLSAPPLPFIAIPTTSGTGAEATKNAVIGVPMHRRKVSLRDDRMLPVLAIVDPALTDGCPRSVTLASGLDALVQVIEPYLSVRASAPTDALTRDAIPRGLSALRRLMTQEDPEARDVMSYVSLVGGIALANAGLGAVHGFAGVIGGRTGMAHGAICGRLLVPSLRENATALAEAGLPTSRIDTVRSLIAAEFSVGEDDALNALEDWIDTQGLPILPPREEDWSEEARMSSSMKGNPVELDTGRLDAILAAACAPRP